MSAPSWLPEGPPELQEATLIAAWQADGLVALAAVSERRQLEAALAALPPGCLAGYGAGVLVGSGGSTGGRRWCLQPLRHLEASAAATAAWLRAQGIDPARCLHLNPLPLHHVSGLMPLVRSRCWGAALRRLSPELLRQPADLPGACPLPEDSPVLLSLVPTQLRRLMASAAATDWLRRCAVIWVGGAALPAELAREARRQRLPLAPCYGATETAAMVCALPPARFLAGEEGCGPPLADVELRLDAATGAVEVRTSRLSLGWLDGAGGVRPLLPVPGGWWRSGDAGRLELGGLQAGGLVVLGRLDGALHSGGETVFPEQLEQRLQQQAIVAELPLAAVLLLAEADPEWGERLVALVRLEGQGEEAAATLLQALKAITAAWPAAERPRRWLLCPTLAPTAAGKWERGAWRRWLDVSGGEPG
ncbi:MAG: AMP-binding protein [Cyanobacteriota bacterium]